MTERREDIDWIRTTFDGNRREQLRHGLAMSVRERLEALDQLTELARRMQAMPKHENCTPVRELSKDVREELPRTTKTTRNRK